LDTQKKRVATHCPSGASTSGGQPWRRGELGIDNKDRSGRKGAMKVEGCVRMMKTPVIEMRENRLVKY